MKPCCFAGLIACGLLVCEPATFGEVKVTVEHNDNHQASPGFIFKSIPPPAFGDTGAKAKFLIIDGKRDPNGGDLLVLNDGQLPESEDEPSQNFFFAAGTDGGR